MTQEQHEWFVDLIPAYAIGAADRDERLALEAHLNVCGDCRNLVNEYRDLEGALLFATPVTSARTGLAEDLRRRLDPAPGSAASRKGLFGFLAKPGFALALVAVALLVFSNVYWAGRVGALERRANEFTSLAQAPGITLQVAQSANEYSALDPDAVVYVQPGSELALLCVYDLPELEQNQTYQAWLVQQDQRVSAGTFGVNEDGFGVLLIEVGKPVSDFDQVGITVEPAGGSPAPTSPRILGGAL